MRSLPRIPSTSQLRTLESEWIKKCDHSWGQVLMEIAGRAAAEVCLKTWEDRPGRVVIVCGTGNNGGDGMVVARYLALWKVPVTVYVVSKSDAEELPSMSSDEAKTNMRLATDLGVDIEALPSDFDSSLTNCSLVVDALFGTGLDRQLEANFKRAIDSINRSLIRTIAIDIPSGINSDTGQIMGAAISAYRTVTFGYLKPGLLQHPGALHAGVITAVDIGLPELPPEDEILLTTRDFVNAILPFRPDDSNKGTYGSVLMIGGSAEMFGATVLSGKSALRAGAGLCMVAAPKSVVPHLPAAEMIYMMLPETDEGTIDPQSIKKLEPEIAKAKAIILGPGISQHPDTITFVHELLSILAESGKGCVIDADALNAIAKAPDKFPKNAPNFVLTPHPKELSRLMGNSVADIQHDRVASARQAAKRFGCTVILKGSRTVTAEANGTAYINPTGNSGMATAGSGDVLSGIIGGLIAQSVPPADAAVTGVYIHGLAGDIAAQDLYGHSGIVAGDISYAVPRAVSEIRQGRRSLLEEQLSGEILENKS